MTIEVTRGGLMESRHHVHWAVAEADGRWVDGEGDAASLTFPRSAAKPFQAMAVLAGGAADAYGFSDEEISILGGSHHGEPFHVEAVLSILRKSGVPVSALQCGAHAPFNAGAAHSLAAEREEASALHSNCSGKHAGLLALARHIGAPLETYMDRRHPTQDLVFALMGRFCGLEGDAIPYGVDGCGLPAPACSLLAAAAGFARFATGKGMLPEDAEAGRRLRDAQWKHPAYVSGTDTFGTLLLEAAPHLASKGGAEGVFCTGNAETGQGLALKVLDGAHRAVSPATLELLLRLGWISDEVLSTLSAFHTTEVLNMAGDVVGVVRPGVG